MPHNLYSPDFAAMLIAEAGQKWRPSNGTEGHIFMESWCATCANDESTEEDGRLGCTIRAATLWLSEDDPRYPAEWCLSATGQPQCTAYEAKATA